MCQNMVFKIQHNQSILTLEACMDLTANSLRAICTSFDCSVEVYSSLEGQECSVMFPAGSANMEGCGTFQSGALLEEGGHLERVLWLPRLVPFPVCYLLSLLSCCDELRSPSSTSLLLWSHLLPCPSHRSGLDPFTRQNPTPFLEFQRARYLAKTTRKTAIIACSLFAHIHSLVLYGNLSFL